MKVAPRGFSRSWRWLFLIVGVSGAVLAADKYWTNYLSFEDFRPDDWFASLAGSESRDANAASLADSPGIPEAESTISRWADRTIFYEPSNGWTLDAPRSARMPLSKTEFASAWLTQQSGENFVSASHTDLWPTAFSSHEFAGTTTAASPNTPTGTNGIWASNVSGNWSTAANWSAGLVADGTGAVADFTQVDLTQDIVVSLDGSRTVGFLEIGDTNATHKYTLSTQIGATLIFDTGAMTHADLSQVSTSAGDTISVPMVFKGELNINNFSSTHEFTITGSIASSASNDFQTIAFNPSVSANAGQIRVNGIISNGLTNSVVSVEVDKGTVIFAGNNSYTGSTFVTGGSTLLVNGNQSAANGLIQVSGAGSVLGGTGTSGGSVFVYGGTITGDTTTGVGTLTLQGNVLLHTGEGAGGTYLANLSGATSDLLAISKVLTLGTDTTLQIVGSADGTTTYILATFGALSSQPGQDRFGTVLGLPTGYSLVYNPTDLELVPTAIPEPATWIGGALALGAIAFARRKRGIRNAERGVRN